MGIGVTKPSNQGKKKGHGISQNSYGDAIIERMASNLEQVEGHKAEIESILIKQRDYKGFSLMSLSSVYGIPSEKLHGYPTDDKASTGHYYAYLRDGVIEVWQATSSIASADPKFGSFKKISAEIGSADNGVATSASVRYGTVPNNYTSGLLYLEFEGELSTAAYKYVDSYVPTAGDEVVVVDTTVMGVTASSEPLLETFCKFYGYPISINSYWDIDKAAVFFSKFHGVVWGDNIGNPDHVANADTVAIAIKAKELNPTLKIFGYVPIGLDPEWQDSSLDLSVIFQRIDNWKATGATHIFLDEYGYDYYVTRERQNACVEYCRSLGMNVCANSWSADYCFSNEPIVLSWADNFEGNPNGLPCILGPNDYLQFENVLYKYHHEPGQDSYANPEQWVNNNQRIIDMYEYMYGSEAEYDGKSYFDVYGTRGYALDAIIDYDQKMYAESYLVALASGMHAHAASVAFWGAAASNYPTYEKPVVRAASRVALGRPVIEQFADTYIGRFTTQIGPDSIEVTWVQKEDEIMFDEASLNVGLTPKKHITSVVFPSNLTVTGAGFFTLTLGSSTDDTRSLSISLTGTETRAELLDKIKNYSYSPVFLEKYEVIQEADRIVYSTRESYTEELNTWWVWHTAGILSTTISAFTPVQSGTDGKSIEYREVRLNGSAIDYGFGAYWRKPRKVNDGYIYFDTSYNRNITYRDGKWYDTNGNLADEFITVSGIPSGMIAMVDSLDNIGEGWLLCDGTNGTPNINSLPYYSMIKK